MNKKKNEIVCYRFFCIKYTITYIYIGKYTIINKQWLQSDIDTLDTH